ncbi:MAG: polysaccharide biosynthesis protein [Clostridia bacterium]|nr:polysaccharide biosynthesis protein [Clostridia bacterium]
MNKYLKTILFILGDILITIASSFLIMRVLNYDVLWCLEDSLVYLLISVGAVCLINLVFGLYTGLWTYAGFWEGIRIGCAAILILFYNLFIAIMSEPIGIEWAIINTSFMYILIFFTRFSPRLKTSLKKYMDKRANANGYTRVMIVGAGSTGSALIREMRTTVNSNMEPVCVVDDDLNKIKRYVNGVKVVGNTSEIVYFAYKYNIQEIIIAMPSVDRKVVSKIILDCQKTGCKIKTVSNMLYDNSKVGMSNLKDVGIDDLLGREQVRVNLDDILGYIEQKTVVVTGGGGSIGSELCRQIAEHNPKLLIIIDIYENNAYDIQQELLRKLPNLNLLTLIASVRDKKKIETIFEEYKPEIVFHAAAHKHVPLMETSPNEAVKNNVGGTLNVAECAGRCGAQRFVLISTDKAVNPTNIMGATKRICEMIIQTIGKKYKNTEYVAVRFGNVLGSNGSVIPLFKKQIKEGGPVTVTHKDIVRYFMTIPEAVSLVLQAGAYAKGGEIFVLNMGEPVRIYDLAENLIRLSGLEPNIDIDIKVIGLRPGEKLYEERLMEEEGLQETENKMISIGKPLEIGDDLFDNIKVLLKEANGETQEMKELVHQLVPTYKIDNTIIRN